MLLLWVLFFWKLPRGHHAVKPVTKDCVARETDPVASSCPVYPYSQVTQQPNAALYVSSSKTRWRIAKWPTESCDIVKCFKSATLGRFTMQWQLIQVSIVKHPVVGNKWENKRILYTHGLPRLLKFTDSPLTALWKGWRIDSELRTRVLGPYVKILNNGQLLNEHVAEWNENGRWGGRPGVNSNFTSQFWASNLTSQSLCVCACETRILLSILWGYYWLREITRKKMLHDAWYIASVSHVLISFYLGLFCSPRIFSWRTPLESW